MCALICFMLLVIRQLNNMFYCSPVSKKRSVVLTLLQSEVLAYPNEETGKTTLWQSIAYPALNIPSFWKVPVFALGRSANVYVIYKDEIPENSVKSPLFSYVSFAKLTKYNNISYYEIRNIVLYCITWIKAHLVQRCKSSLYIKGFTCTKSVAESLWKIFIINHLAFSSKKITFEPWISDDGGCQQVH